MTNERHQQGHLFDLGEPVSKHRQETTTAPATPTENATPQALFAIAELREKQQRELDELMSDKDEEFARPYVSTRRYPSTKPQQIIRR